MARDSGGTWQDVVEVGVLAIRSSNGDEFHRHIFEPVSIHNCVRPDTKHRVITVMKLLECALITGNNSKPSWFVSVAGV